MASLFDLLDSATQGLDIQSVLGDQAGQFLAIAQTAGQLIDSPPGDAGAFLGQLQNLGLPQLNFGGDFAGVFNQLAPALQGQLGGLVEPVTAGMQSLQGQSQDGLLSSIAPLLKLITDLQTLLSTDWSAGLIDTGAPAPAPAPPAPPAPGAPATLPPAPAPKPVISAAQVSTAKALVDALPADMSVKALLIWLHGKVGIYGLDDPYVRAIPLIDDLRDPLDSLVRWDGFTGAQLAAELAQTLQRVASVIAQHSSEALTAPLTAAQPLIAALPTALMQQHATDLSTALQALKDAVVAHDNTAVATQLGLAQAAVAALNGVNTTLAARDAELLALQQALQDVPGTLETRMARLLLLLTPRATWADMAEAAGAGSVPDLNAQAMAPLTQLFGRVQESFTKLLDLLDVSTALAPVTDTVGNIQGGIEQLEQALVQLTSTAHAQFAQAKATLDGIGLTQVMDEAKEVMDTAVQQVQSALDTGFAPVANALTQAVQAIDTALSTFDPEQLTAPIKDTLAAIKGIFEGSDVKAALDQLKQLKAIAAQLDQLSFAPVADEVISAIDAIKSALSAIDGANLPSPMPDLIREAMSVLPESVKPLTDPLITELGTLIEQGPVPLLGELKDLPKPLFDQIRALDPKTLLGDDLGQPFQALRDKLAEFKPDQWLDAIEQELTQLRERIRASASPRGVLQPLAASFDQFMQQLAQFKPGDLLAPITTQLEDLLHQLGGILPDLGFITDLQALLARIQSVGDLLAQLVSVARHVADKVAKISSPATQLEAWLDEIFAKLQDVSALQVPLQAISDAVTAASSGALTATWQSTTAGLRNALAQANARTLHTQLVTRRNALATAVAAVAAPSPQVQALQTWLATFAPGAPPFAAGFLSLVQLEEAYARAHVGVSTAVDSWDARYQQPGGALQSLVLTGATADELRSWVREALTRQLGKPVVDLLQYLSLAGQVLNAFTDSLDALSQAFSAKLAAALAAPQGLLDTYTALQSLLTRLSELDLSSLQAEVESLYQTLLDQARALDPRTLEQTLSDKFDALLDTLSLSHLIGPTLRSDINQTYAKLVQKVDSLDPQLLLVEPMQSLYDDDIVPLLDVFDISETVDELVSFLSGLDDQLSTQMDRVDTAYQAMLAAAPGSNGSSASLSVGASV
jgi:hypothetical protein